MGRNPLDGIPPSEELLARAVAALVREWDVSETEARAAIERCQGRQRRLGPELARAQLEDVIDLTAPDAEWVLYLDHDGSYVYGRVECA